MAQPKPSLKARALRYLSAREHSRVELERKLARHAQEGEDVEALLDALEASKLLSQERFSESLVHRRAARYGNSRIVAELQSHGIGGEALAGIKGSLADDEVARACKVLRKKFGQSTSSDRIDAEKAVEFSGQEEARGQEAARRAKQARFLVQRGFSGRAVQAALRAVGADTEGGDGGTSSHGGDDE